MSRRAVLATLVGARGEHKRRIETRRLLFYRPYAKQLDSHAAGMTGERLRYRLIGHKILGGS